MIISLNSKTLLGKSVNWKGQPGIYYSMCNINMKVRCVRSFLRGRSLTMVDDEYEICDTKLGMKSLTFCYMVNSK